MKAKGYQAENGDKPFRDWFGNLDVVAAAKVNTAIERMKDSNFSNVEPVGEGVSEYKIDFGPGYRIYFAKDGEELILLLGGGTKKGQQKDIDTAKDRWKDYKARKKALEKPAPKKVRKKSKSRNDERKR